jgi:hypothetical protein
MRLTREFAFPDKTGGTLLSYARLTSIRSLNLFDIRAVPEPLSEETVAKPVVSERGEIALNWFPRQESGHSTGHPRICIILGVFVGSFSAALKLPDFLLFTRDHPSDLL